MNDPVNMAHFIEAKSDQLNSDDLMEGPRTITVTGVSANPDSSEQPVSIHFEGDNRKPFKPCKTMRRLIVGVWGADASQYVGRSMTLYRDPNVQFGGMNVGGIRISHMSDIDKPLTVALLVTRGRKKPFQVQPLKVERKTDEPGEDKAAKWAETFKADVASASDLGSLAEAHDKASKVLTKLEKDRPDLHEVCIAALDARREELADDDVFEGAE